MNNIHMAVAVAQQTEDERRKMPPDEIMKKAWRVINSCQTPKQAEIAMKYLELLTETYQALVLIGQYSQSPLYHVLCRRVRPLQRSPD